MTATHFGLLLLALAAFGVWSTLRVGSLSGRDWDLMAAKQRQRWIEDRRANNPNLRSRH